MENDPTIKETTLYIIDILDKYNVEFLLSCYGTFNIIKLNKLNIEVYGLLVYIDYDHSGSFRNMSSIEIEKNEDLDDVIHMIGFFLQSSS